MQTRKSVMNNKPHRTRKCVMNNKATFPLQTWKSVMSNKPTLANTDKKEHHTKLQWDVSASQPSPGSAHAPHHHHASHNTPTQGPESKQNKACQRQLTLQSRLHCTIITPPTTSRHRDLKASKTRHVRGANTAEQTPPHLPPPPLYQL